MDEKAVEIGNLSKSYGERKALDDVSFSIDKGEIVGFLGANGAGKSTTMNILTGFIPPDSGTVRICGIDMLENPIEAKRKIGYLPETPPLYDDRTVLEYLSFAYDLKRCKGNKRERIAECMESVGLCGVKNRLIKNLSKGYRQRVALAQAVINKPEVLILDEPTVGLDPVQIMEIRELIRQIGKDSTVILSTHILQETEAVCSRIIIIGDGRIKADDTMENLKIGTDGRTLESVFMDAIIYS